MAVLALGPLLQTLYAASQADLTGYVGAQHGCFAFVAATGVLYRAVPTGTGTASGTSYLTGTGLDWQCVIGGKLADNLDGNGFSITNFDNGHTTVDVALSSDPSATVLAVTIGGLTASKKYNATLGVRVIQYVDSDHTINGSIDIVIDMGITTDGSAVATCTFATTPVPDISRLPAGLGGATATVAASTGGFTISATRVASTASHARAHWWVNKFEDVT